MPTLSRVHCFSTCLNSVTLNGFHFCYKNTPLTLLKLKYYPIKMDRMYFFTHSLIHRFIHSFIYLFIESFKQILFLFRSYSPYLSLTFSSSSTPYSFLHFVLSLKIFVLYCYVVVFLLLLLFLRFVCVLILSPPSHTTFFFCIHLRPLYSAL